LQTHAARMRLLQNPAQFVPSGPVGCNALQIPATGRGSASGLWLGSSLRTFHRPEACSDVAGGKSAEGGRRHRLVVTVRKVDPVRVVWARRTPRRRRAFQARMGIGIASEPWASLRCAHGYSRLAFQAVRTAIVDWPFRPGGCLEDVHPGT
jgi:hypothetical protein